MLFFIGVTISTSWGSKPPTHRSVDFVVLAYGMKNMVRLG